MICPKECSAVVPKYKLLDLQIEMNDVLNWLLLDYMLQQFLTSLSVESPGRQPSMSAQPNSKAVSIHSY